MLRCCCSLRTLFSCKKDAEDGLQEGGSGCRGLRRPCRVPRLAEERGIQKPRPLQIPPLWQGWASSPRQVPGSFRSHHLCFCVRGIFADSGNRRVPAADAAKASAKAGLWVANCRCMEHVVKDRCEMCEAAQGGSISGSRRGTCHSVMLRQEARTDQDSGTADVGFLMLSVWVTRQRLHGGRGGSHRRRCCGGVHPTQDSSEQSRGP